MAYVAVVVSAVRVELYIERKRRQRGKRILRQCNVRPSALPVPMQNELVIIVERMGHPSHRPTI